MSKIKRYYTIEEIESQPSRAPIWVINTSGEHPRTKQIAELILQVPIPDSQPEQVLLQATWLPVNLTQRIPRKFLLATPLLRRYEADRLIRFITPEYAELLNNYDGADEERKSLADRATEIENASTARAFEDGPVKYLSGTQRIGDIVMAGDEGTGEKPRNGRVPHIPDSAFKTQVEAANSTDDLSQEYRNWFSELEGQTDVAVLNSLRSRGRNFTRKELIHLSTSSEIESLPKTKATVLRNLSRGKK